MFLDEREVLQVPIKGMGSDWWMSSGAEHTSADGQ